MRRRRFQRGSVSPRKHGKKKVWVGQWWEAGNKRSKVLGLVSRMTKAEAEGIISAILQPINAGVTQKGRPVYTFEQYVERSYLPHTRRGWKESTEGTADGNIRVHLIPEFGPLPLLAIGRERMQDFLDSKAPELGKSIVTHLRWFLNAIFKLAMSDGLVASNPAAELVVPKGCKLGRKMRSLSESEVVSYIEALDLRERVVAQLAIYSGLRPGEAFALRNNSIAGDVALVHERVYKGVFNTPKNNKPREALLSPCTLASLKEWLQLSLDPRPDAFLFPSEKLTTPLSPENVWKRNMKPKLAKVGLSWATFQVLRKTNATLMKKAGIDPKVGADQRGHTLGVSIEVYTQSDLSQKRAAVRAIESLVTRKPKAKRTA